MKKCKQGYYYCYTDKKCKKIPVGYRRGLGGYLRKETEEEKKNGNGNGNGNGSNGNGHSSSNGGGNGHSNGSGNGGAAGNGGGMSEAYDTQKIKKIVKQLRKSNYKNKIIHVVAPTVWAWRSYRARKFANIFDEIFLLFNFEKKYFNFYNLNKTFIGHTIFHIKKRENKGKYQYLSFLPGSRQNEVLKLMKYFSYIEKYISKNNLNYKIFIPTLPHLVSLIKENSKQWKTETIISTDMSKFDQYYEDVYISITCSGTASLEIAKRNIPQIVILSLIHI